MNINTFCGTFNVLAIFFVVAISLITARKYSSDFFIPWINAHVALALFMILQQFSSFERFLPYALLEGALIFGETWFLLQTTDLLLKRNHQRQELIALAGLFLLFATMGISGLPFNTIAILPAIVVSLAMIRCGMVFLKPSDFLGGMGFALWLGWPLIILGCTPLFYPLVHGENDWIGTLIASLLHIMGGVGMIVYLLELNNHQTSLAKERYRNLFEQAHDGIFLADANGMILDVNTSGCSLTGHHREDLLQRTIMDLLIPSDPAKAKALMNDLFAGQPQLLEANLKHRDGNTIPIEMSLKRLSEGPYQAIVRDISERQRLNRLQQEQIQLLQRADRMKDDFLGIVSTELGRPLAELHELGAVLHESLGESHRGLIDRIQEKSDRMLGIIEDLRQFAKEEGGFKMYSSPSQEGSQDWTPIRVDSRD